MLEAEGANFETEVNTHNILADDSMRVELKDYSDWPTFPQVYI
jgi:glutaredoxin-related protein